MVLHRVFIAFRVSDEAKTELERAQAELESLNRRGRIRWSKPEGMHITLEFLGEVDEAQIEKVKEILSRRERDPATAIAGPRLIAVAVAGKKYPSFSYWLSQIDAFPNKEQANVIIVKVGEEGRASAKIQAELTCELKKIGLYGDNHPWHPHITLGRNKSHHSVQGLNSVKINKIVWQVDKVELIESDLSPEGPRYMVLAEYPLKL